VAEAVAEEPKEEAGRQTTAPVRYRLRLRQQWAAAGSTAAAGSWQRLRRSMPKDLRATSMAL